MAYGGPTRGGCAADEDPKGDRSDAVSGDVVSSLPLMITCTRFGELVPRYLAERLPGPARRRFELHRRLCGGCSVHLQKSTESLRALLEREWQRRDATRGEAS